MEGEPGRHETPGGGISSRITCAPPRFAPCWTDVPGGTGHPSHPARHWQRYDDVVRGNELLTARRKPNGPSWRRHMLIGKRAIHLLFGVLEVDTLYGRRHDK